MKNFLGIVCLSIALFLFSLNITGLFFNFNYLPTDTKNIQTISNIDDLKKKNTESPENYITRLVNSIYFGMHHFFVDYQDGVDWGTWKKTSVHYTDNYVIYLTSLFFNMLSKNFYVEFSSPKDALHRGYGYCSQFALVLGSVCDSQKNIQAQIIADLKYHVIATVLIDGKVFTVDPNFNVVMPFSFDEIGENPQIIRKYYKLDQAGNTINNDLLLFIENVYREQFDNHQKVSVKEYLGKRYYFLIFAKISKWAIPFFLLVFGMYLIRPSKKKARHALSA